MKEQKKRKNSFLKIILKKQKTHIINTNNINSNRIFNKLREKIRFINCIWNLAAERKNLLLQSIPLSTFIQAFFQTIEVLIVLYGHLKIMI